MGGLGLCCVVSGGLLMRVGAVYCWGRAVCDAGVLAVGDLVGNWFWLWLVVNSVDFYFSFSFVCVLCSWVMYMLVHLLVLLLIFDCFSVGYLFAWVCLGCWSVYWFAFCCL